MCDKCKCGCDDNQVGCTAKKIAVDWTKPIQTEYGTPLEYVGTESGTYFSRWAWTGAEKHKYTLYPTDEFGIPKHGGSWKVINVPEKPREFWVAVYVGGAVRVFDTEVSAIMDCTLAKEFIKVVEVK